MTGSLVHEFLVLPWPDNDPTGYEGVLTARLRQHSDDRGALSELFRADDQKKLIEKCLSVGVAGPVLPPWEHPPMGYFSITRQGFSRGPHLHEAQHDMFILLDGRARVLLLDRPCRRPPLVFEINAEFGSQPMLLCVPPGVIHGYLALRPIFMLNFPSHLHCGWDRESPEDVKKIELLPDHPAYQAAVKHGFKLS